MQPATKLWVAVERQESWQFDIRSALIGALLAWILVGLLYSQRKAIQRAIQSVWEPFVAWRRRVRASQEEKYVRALKQMLDQHLLFTPKPPDLILQEPEYFAPAPLPTSVAEAAHSPRLITVPFAGLLRGHNKVVITGSPGSGRTSTLVLAALRVIATDEDSGSKHDYERLPFWINAATLTETRKRDTASSEERIALMASTSVPGLVPKWVLNHLRKERCLVIIDNWESLSLDDCMIVARWIAEADAQFENVFWLIAAADEGYGYLVEHGFVPAQVIMEATRLDMSALVEAWSQILNVPLETVPDELIDALARAAAAQCPLWELHTRIVLYLRAGELPDRPVEVLGRLLETALEAVDLGKGQEAITEQAIDLAIHAIIDIAAAHRLERNSPSNTQVRDIITAVLPPKEDRPRRLEGAVRQLVDANPLVVEDGGRWTPIHAVWADYLTALHLALDEKGEDMVHAHINDPTWLNICEFYAGLADIGASVTAIIKQSELHGDHEALLRAARWGSVAEPDRPWLKELNKSLAQTFMEEGLNQDTRLRIARALNLVAGSGARAFFLRMLRQTDPSVQCAALRGLGWARASRDMPILGAALRESQDALRESAVLALRDMKSPGATAFLVESLPHASEALMLVITQALAVMPDGPQALDEATRYPDLLVRRAAAQGLGSVAQPWALERLLDIAREDPEWLVRSAADTALQINEEQAAHKVGVPAPPQVDQLDWLIAWAARQGLGLGVGDAALVTLGEAARQGNVDAKILSALTLAQVGRQSDLEILEPLLGEDDPDVQQTVEWAIRRIRKRYHTYHGDVGIGD